MLNDAMKLNPRLLEADAAQKPTRHGYGEGLEELGEKDPRVVVLTGDLSESTRCDAFEKKFPERFFDCGVAEQNMAAVAAGMGVTGMVPFISSYATFSPGKNWETIRTTIVYNGSNVKIAGHHSGIVTGPDGATHEATEDIAITRCWPKMRVLVPCDAVEAKKMTIQAAAFPGPVYLRFTREKTAVMTTEETPCDGCIYVYWITEAPQAVIFGTGHLLYWAILAGAQLEKEGINCLVANVSTIKPLDESTALSLARAAGAVVTVEDHQVEGGLGGALAEFYARAHPVPMEFVGLRNTFAESGSPRDLIAKYGLGTDAIMQAVKKVIARKPGKGPGKK